MKKGHWKCYDVDDCTTVCGRSVKEVMDWINKGQIADEECMYKPPMEVDMKQQYMNYTIKDIPLKRHQTKATETWEGYGTVSISLKQAARYYIKKYRPKEPFIICTCGL